MNRPMPVFTQRLPRWQRLSLYTAGLTVAASGIAWLIFVLDGAAEDPFASTRDTQHLVTVLHGVASLTLILLVGAMIPVHVRLGWRFRNRFATGVTLLTTLLALCATGMALYYVSNERARGFTAASHEIIGIAAIVLFLLHRFGRKSPR